MEVGGGIPADSREDYPVQERAGRERRKKPREIKTMGSGPEVAPFQRRGPVFLPRRTRPGIPPTPWAMPPPPLLPPPPPPPCGLSTHPFTTKKGSSMDMTPAGLLPSWSPHAVPSASQAGPPVRFRGLLQPSARPLSPYGLEQQQQQQQRRHSAPVALLPTQRVSAPLAGGAPVHVRREQRHSPLEQKDVHLAPRDEVTREAPPSCLSSRPNQMRRGREGLSQ